MRNRRVIIDYVRDMYDNALKLKDMRDEIAPHD